MENKTIVENYNGFLNSKLSELEKAALTPDLDQEVLDLINKAIAGLKTELKFVAFRLSSFEPKAPEAEVVSDDTVTVTRSVN